MKHEPNPAIHMEKQLVWTYILGGKEPQGISRAGQTVLSRLMESQIWTSLPALGSVGEEFRKGQWPVPNFQSGRKLCPSFCFDTRHFSSSLYATVAFQAATLVLELRESESE